MLENIVVGLVTWIDQMFLILMLLNNLCDKVSDKNQLNLGNEFKKVNYAFFVQLHYIKMSVLTYHVK